MATDSVDTVTQSMKFIEDIAAQDKPLDSAALLTDEQLERGGLVRVQAYMRTTTSAAAARKAKQRETQSEQGIKQANITGPAEIIAIMKAITTACKTGDSIEKAILAAVPTVTSHTLVTNPEIERLAAIGRKLENLSGWKKLMAKALQLIP